MELGIYFDYVKKLEFQGARKSITDIKDDNLRVSLFNLILVLENEGQKHNLGYFQFKPENIPADNRDLIKSISLLTQSNAEIVYNKITEKTFDNLTEALNISQIIGYKPLVKQILLSILNLYRKDVIQINKEYEYFLGKYKDNMDDPIDHAYYVINNFIFQSKSDDPVNGEFHRSADMLDSVFNNISTSSKLIPLYLFEKGIYNEIIGRNNIAKDNYNTLLSITTRAPYYRYVNFGAYLKLSEIAANEGKFEIALKLLEQTKEYTDYSQPFISDYYYYSYGSGYHDKAGNCDKALIFLKKAITLENEINKINSLHKRSEALVAYQTLEKEKRILQQDKDLLLEKERKTRTRNIALSLGVMLFLGVIIGILLYRNSKRQQRISEQQKELQKQKVETLLKEQELLSIDAMIAGQEKERQQVANELHDDLGSLMATVKLHLENIKTDKKDASFKMASNLLEEAYQKIRGIAHTRNSGVMAKKGLVPAIHKMAQTISETNKIKLEVNDFGMDERLENSLELSIFRIIQELTTNMIKHAKATKGSIQLTQHENNLNIIVEDNGKGFDMSGIERTKRGMGLGTIEKRIEHLEGSFTVDSILGKGTSVIIDIPI